MEQAQASGVCVTVMNHIEHILNLPHVRGACVELHPLPGCPLSKKWDPLTTKKKIINMTVCSAHKGRVVPEKLIYWIPWHFSCGRYVVFMGELLEPLIMLS